MDVQTRWQHGQAAQVQNYAQAAGHALPHAQAPYGRPPLPAGGGGHKVAATHGVLAHGLHQTAAVMAPGPGARTYFPQPAAAAPAAPALYASGGWPTQHAFSAQHFPQGPFASAQGLQPQAYGLAVPGLQTALPAASAACRPGAGGHAAGAAVWPTLQPHGGPVDFFQQAQQAAAHCMGSMQAMLQQAAGAVMPAAAAAPPAGHTSRRMRQRRPSARRSLLNLFDAAAASEEQSADESEEEGSSDSECGVPAVGLPRAADLTSAAAGAWDTPPRPLRAPCPLRCSNRATQPPPLTPQLPFPFDALPLAASPPPPPL